MSEPPEVLRIPAWAMAYANELVDAGLIDTIKKVDHRLGGFYTTANWLRTANYHFGGLSPLELILMGRGNKVREFVLNAVEGQLP